MLQIRLRRLVAAGATALLAGLAAGTAVLLDHSWTTANRAAAAAIAQKTEAVENTLNRLLLGVDGGLASLPELLDSLTVGNEALSPARAGRLLRSLNGQLFIFRDILLVTPDGQLWASALQPHPRHPVPALDAPSDPPAVLGPARNPVTGEWSFYIRREIHVPRIGALVALAEVPVPAMAQRLAETANAPGLRITVERTNGRLLVSVPHDELRMAHAPEVSSPPRSADVAAPSPGILARPGEFAASRTALYGDVVVTLSAHHRIVLAEWYRDRDRILVGVALAGLLMIACAIVLSGALRRNGRMETERNRARLMLESAIEAMSDGFVMWDSDDRLVTCNARYRDLYAISAPFIRPGARFDDIIRSGAERGQYPDVGPDLDAFVAGTVAWHRGDHGTMERLLPDGRSILITERRMPEGGIVGIRTDITALRRALDEAAAAGARESRALDDLRLHHAALLERDRALQTQNLLFDAALNNMSHGLLMADARDSVIVCNRRFLEIFGLSAEPEPGTGVAALFAAIVAAGRFDADTAAHIQAGHAGLAARGRSNTFVAIGPDGRALSVAQRPMADGGWVATYEDVTQQKLAEGRIRFLAHHDDLTKLPNRVLFRAEIGAALGRFREDGIPVALLYLDLDKFKDVNDTLGHSVGDRLLQVVAERLRACLRDVDIVARLGGDEFAVACRPSFPRPDAQDLAARIIAALSAPYEVGDVSVTVGVSVGIALAEAPTIDVDTLLKNADLALYQAKARGRGIVAVFEPDMETRLRERMALEADLRAAAAAHRFELAYQPIVDLGTERVSGFEALLRWPDPERGLVSPADFVPLAEDTGLIVPIGEWILHQACRDAAALPRGVKVAVNLSPVQLRSHAIVEAVRAALDASGLDPARLELEITESALLHDNETTIAVLHALRALGPRIVLDDFGTGFSSLSHLRMFPFGKIKIDQSFVREMTTRPDCAAIVGSTVDLARRLGMVTTAEGVETAEQFVRVRATGCTEAQGYLFGRPRSILHAVGLVGGGPVGDGSAAAALPLRIAGA